MAVKASATITLSFMVDVKAVYRYYKLQASTASAPEVPTTEIPYGWTDSEPTYTEGSTNTLYFVDKTVFTNDSFVYSAVSKSTSYEAAKAAYNKAVNAQNTANEASKTATNFMQFVDGEGLYVGNKQSGAWEGVRTRMDTDSFDVIDQDGNTLASYGAEMSITPNNTSGYKIKMGDSVTIGTRYPDSTEGLGSVVIGYQGRATKSYAYAEGYQTLASASYAHAEGYQTTASGLASHAEGDLTIASGKHSHAEGGNTEASAQASHAEGAVTMASALYSHAEGLQTTASGLASHAEGELTIASGKHSHAEGSQTEASSSYAHAEGGGTTASGEASHAEGYLTIASGLYSHAEGYKTTASAMYSHASGGGTKATAEGQFAIGKNNATNDNAAFIIGNGSYTLKADGTIVVGTPSNALEVDWDGNLTASGNIYYNIPVCGSAYDVDTMRTTGKYYCGDAVSNKPLEPGNESGSNGWLDVMRYTDDYVYQRYVTCTGNVYERYTDPEAPKPIGQEIAGWNNWRIVYYHKELADTVAETLLINFLSNMPYTINIATMNKSGIPGAVYSYTAYYPTADQNAKINANTSGLGSSYGTIRADKAGITIKSAAAYLLFITVTQ